MRDVDRVIEEITKEWPTVTVRQLKVAHPTDDDGLWFFTQPNSQFEVQIESSTGMCPFLVETAETSDRFDAASVGDTARIVTMLLHLEPNSR